MKYIYALYIIVVVFATVILAVLSKPLGGQASWDLHRTEKRVNHMCVRMYEHSSYRGRQRTVCGAEPYIPAIGFNDMASSIKLDCEECSVIVWQHAYYTGKCMAYGGDVEDLGNMWNDEISSLIVVPYTSLFFSGC